MLKRYETLNFSSLIQIIKFNNLLVFISFYNIKCLFTFKKKKSLIIIIQMQMKQKNDVYPIPKPSSKHSYIYTSRFIYKYNNIQHNTTTQKWRSVSEYTWNILIHIYIYIQLIIELFNSSKCHPIYYRCSYFRPVSQRRVNNGRTSLIG